MARTRRGTPGGGNFPQLGSEGEQYQMTTAKTGEPKLTKAGNPEMAWRFPNSPTLTSPHERLAATATFVHSIETTPDALRHFGEQWYPKVNAAVQKGIAKRGFLGAAEDRMLSGAGVVAAVSPNMDWDRANIGAFSDLSKLKASHWDTIMGARGGSGRGAKASQAAAREVVRGTSVQSASIANLQKVGRLVRGEDPHSVIPEGTASKTHSFMHNIADPSNPHFVTIDGRAFDTLTNRMRPWEVGRGITGSGKSMPGRYQASRDIIQSVAGSMGLHPSAAQAISWTNVKYGVEQGGVVDSHSGAFDPSRHPRERKQGPTRSGQPYFHPETGAPAALLPHVSGRQFR